MRTARHGGIKRAHRCEPKLIVGRDVQDEELILSEKFQCMTVLEGQGHIRDPASYIHALVRAFEAEGGQSRQAEVQVITKRDGRVCSARTNVGEMECSELVLTTGIWSKELMSMLGLKIQLEAERGYHLTFETPNQMPKNTMMMVAGKFGVNPMDIGLRCAGTVELGDHTTGPSDAPLGLLKSSVAKAFPNLKSAKVCEWMGFRPSTPDSLAVIGELQSSGIYCGFGHQHIGLTAGPKTERLLASLISRQRPNADISAFDPQRFAP